MSLENISSAELGRIAAIIKSEAGIHLPEEKKSLVSSRLGKRVRALKMNGFGEYCDFVTSSAGADERHEMLSALTTNVTRFFREDHHFEHLRDNVLPDLIERARSGQRVRIWSAACSSGEEPYSIAMTVLAAAPDAAKLNLRILATDIDPKILAQARRGAYPAEALEPAPKDLAERCFETDCANGVTAAQCVRELISFKLLNLIGDWPMKGPFDVIFCRNVLIYFEQDTQDKVISRFAKLTASGGTLCLGHSERVSNDLSGLYESTGFTSYRRR
ncbi:MAG: protein-glutamate O-methyltransferase [Pseudomonadota bacterium]